jgi:hypothetical protein
MGSQSADSVWNLSQIDLNVRAIGAFMWSPDGSAPPGTSLTPDGVEAMKKDQVKVGGIYTAKVPGGIAQVKITAEKWKGDKHEGWVAVNTATKRPVRIRSAQKLRPPSVAAPAAEAPAKEAAPPPPVAAKRKKAVRPVPAAKRGAKPKGDRPLSGLDAAAKVLADSGKEMRVGEIVEAMEQKGLWKSKAGKTPEATIYAAIIREIRDRGVDGRFAKKDRGVFAAARG